MSCYLRQLFSTLAAILLVVVLYAPADAADAAAFEEIFNGQDLSGWVVEGTSIRKDGDKTLPVWTVVDGEVRCGGGGFGFLRFDRKVCDFVLQAEFKPEPRANSGIGIRTVPYRSVRQTRPSFAAYEIQLQDDAGKPADEHSTGSLYRYVAPTENAIKPAGQWNTVEIRCTGPRIEITINDRKVQDVDQSKIPAIKDKPLCGYVCLQNHGSPCAFRNVRLQTVKGAE
ncbi:MAG TPA: DUF1080 domain-containing protein [Pirellulales bacterium]|nr:DUF1080 domain-containing protein [Pirellulales bacterium]